MTSHMPQGPVHASPASNDHSCNAFESYTPEGYTTDVSSTGSPTPANVSCCSGSGATAKIAASTSQYESDQALEALPPTKEQAGARSDAESDKMASEVLSLRMCMVCMLLVSVACPVCILQIHATSTCHHVAAAHMQAGICCM